MFGWRVLANAKLV